MRRWVYSFAITVVFSSILLVACRDETCTEKVKTATINLFSLDTEQNLEEGTIEEKRDDLKIRLNECNSNISYIKIPLRGTLSALDLSILANDVQLVNSQLDSLSNEEIRKEAVSDLGVSPLHLAARYASPEIIELLAERYLHVDVRDKFGNTPMMASVGGFQDDIENTETLVRLGANVRAMSDSGTALRRAVEEGDLAVVRYLVQQGGFRCAEGADDKESLLQAAEELKQKEVVDLLNNLRDLKCADK